MNHWWRAGLSRQQAEKMKREAQMLIEGYGSKAKDMALEKAGAYGRRYFREACQWSRIAGCIGDLSKQLDNSSPGHQRQVSSGKVVAGLDP